MRPFLLPLLFLTACSAMNAGGGAGDGTPSPSAAPSASLAASASVQSTSPSSPVLPSPGGTWNAAGHTVSVWVASDDASRQQGLSGQQSLAANTGLVLYWAAPAEVRIWMPDMNFPLDVIFVSQNKVVSLYANVPVCPSRADCPTFGPDQAIDYVVEVPAGSAASWGLKTGDTVSLSLPGPIPTPSMSGAARPAASNVSRALLRR